MLPIRTKKRTKKMKRGREGRETDAEGADELLEVVEERDIVVGAALSKELNVLGDLSKELVVTGRGLERLGDGLLEEGLHLLLIISLQVGDFLCQLLATPADELGGGVSCREGCCCVGKGR